jgi:hypothetical protein
MTKSMISIFSVATFFITGCDLSTESANDFVSDFQAEANSQEVAAAPSTSPDTSGSSSPSTPSSSGVVSAGTGGFLWKPDSESTGNLVVLLPGSTRGRTQRVATISGSFGSESASMRHESHNGGRPHFYFSRPGSSYGNNITVQAPLTDGSVYSIVVPNGSRRFE